MQSILKRSDYAAFLFRMKFGGGDALSACSREEAYADLKRTLRGRGKFPRAKEARQQADAALIKMITAIRDMNAATQKDFDKWHRRACECLTAIYAKNGYKSFSVGQAQKWLNMAFKYNFTIGEERLPGFTHLYGLCHVPLDNILIGRLEKYGFKLLGCAWSKLVDYDTYLDRQLWVRRKFPLAPLDVEFQLWMGRQLRTN